MLKLPFDRMAASVHEGLVNVCRMLDLESLKPAGFEELLVPYDRLSPHTREYYEGLMRVAVARLREEGYIVFTRGMVVFVALVLGIDIGLLLILLRILL